MISIITVVRNGEKTIRQTIESVCTQTVLPMEYIIVDGVSTDSTLSIVEEYRKKYPFIKIVTEKERGIYRAINLGIQLAQGKLIGVIHSDDWYERDALENMLRAYNTNGSGVYYGILRFILNEREFFLQRANYEFINKMMVPHPSTFVSADLYKKYGSFDPKYKSAGDLELFVRFIDHNVPFYSLDNIIANFRSEGDSSTPKALIECLKVRRGFGHITTKQYYFRMLKLRVKSFLNY